MLFQFTVLSAAKLPDNWEELTGPFRPPENWVEAPEFVPVSDQQLSVVVLVCCVLAGEQSACDDI